MFEKFKDLQYIEYTARFIHDSQGDVSLVILHSEDGYFYLLDQVVAAMHNPGVDYYAFESIDQILDTFEMEIIDFVTSISAETKLQELVNG